MVSEVHGKGTQARPNLSLSLLTDTFLRACLQGCTNKGGALQLAACMVAALASGAGQGLASCADHITGVTAARAVQSLPYTLPLLMEGPAWQHSLPALLPKLLAVLQAVGPGVVGAGMAKRCLLAVRHLMPPELWAVLSAEACSP